VTCSVGSLTGGGNARIAQVDDARIALDLRTTGQQRGVGAIRMPGGNDARAVDAQSHRVAGLEREQAIEREAQVGHAVDRLALPCRRLQAARQFERTAAPQRAVAADVLHVQAGQAVAGEVAAEIAVAAARAAQSVREQHQRQRRVARRFGRQVQPHRHLAAARLVAPVGLDEGKALARLHDAGRRRAAPIVDPSFGAGRRPDTHRAAGEPGRAAGKRGRQQSAARDQSFHSAVP
jgi:hypothetical protein